MIAPHVHIPFDRIPEYIDLIIENRLNLEIYFSSASLDTVSNKSIFAVMEILTHNPSLSIHAPFMDISPGAVDSKVREVMLGRFSHILDISEILKPKTIVFHSGYDKWKYELKLDLWLEKSLMTWQPLNARAASQGVKIAIENIFEEAPINLKILMEEMNSDNFGVCFDTGHFNLFSKSPLKDWIASLKPYIIELHLHDNDRTSDQHLPVGDGTFNFISFFELLSNKNCIYTLEAHSPENVLKSMKALHALTAAF
ncbi:MAG: AP endonuclease [Nitrospira bacterium HGW-Nitrospira-1]|nr:MAG: AP endonuclease [Nitrospira bacterium HGW-Nitrospira-1]